MSKQIYSLVLSEQVVEKVDREALIRGISRSQIINDLLCQSFGVWTPDLKMNRVMDLMTEAFRDLDNLQMVSATHGNTLQLRTSVSYKYKPKLKYVLEMSGKSQPLLANLRIYSRTTSEPFLQCLVMFFGFISDFEESIAPQIGLRQVLSTGYAYEDNKFVKRFECDWTTTDVGAEAIAAYLISYIQFLDETLKMYFDNYGNWAYIEQQTLTLYKKYL